MFKTSVKLMKLALEGNEKISLAIDAKEVFEDLAPGRPDDKFEELPYEDWQMLVLHKLEWKFGDQYIVSKDGNMYIKPDYASQMAAVAPSFVAEAFIAHLSILHDTFYSGYNLAYLEMEQLEPEAEEEAEEESGPEYSGGTYL